MSDKKQIDRLFQEKFKGFDVEPDDMVWENIHDRLHKDKRKRRIIPIWWKLGGVAAALFLMLTVGNVLYNEFSSINNANSTPVVTSDKTDSKNKNNTVGSKNSATDNTTIAAENDINSSHDTTDSLDNTISGDSNVTTNDHPQNKNNPASSKHSKRNSVVNSEVNSNLITQQQNSRATKNGVVKNKSSNLPELNTNPSDAAKNNLLKESANSKNAIANVKMKQEEQELEKTENVKTNQKTIEEAIAEAIAEANNDKEKEEDEKLNRWSITPNVAPVYFNSLG